MTEPPVERRNPDLSAVEIAKLEGRVEQGFTKLEGQLDTVIAELRAERDARRVAAEIQQKSLDDHETRLRVVEDRKTVAPWQLWSVALGLAAMAGSVAAVWNALK